MRRSRLLAVALIAACLAASAALSGPPLRTAHRAPGNLPAVRDALLRHR